MEMCERADYLNTVQCPVWGLLPFMSGSVDRYGTTLTCADHAWLSQGHSFILIVSYCIGSHSPAIHHVTYVNTLRTGDADLRFSITTVQDG